jgi:hypothetical protein
VTLYQPATVIKGPKLKLRAGSVVRLCPNSAGEAFKIEPCALCASRRRAQARKSGAVCTPASGALLVDDEVVARRRGPFSPAWRRMFPRVLSGMSRHWEAYDRDRSTRWLGYYRTTS